MVIGDSFLVEHIIQTGFEASIKSMIRFEVIEIIDGHLVVGKPYSAYCKTNTILRLDDPEIIPIKNE